MTATTSLERPPLVIEGVAGKPRRTAVRRRRPVGLDRAAPAGVSRLYVIWTLLLAALLSWRNGVYYSGGLDPTVVAKAALTVLALVLAIDAAYRAAPRSRLGLRSLLLVIAYLVATMFGAVASASIYASAVLVIRLGLVAATLVCALIAYPIATSVRTAVLSMAGVGVLLAATGIHSIRQGRLGGGLLPVNSNQLALLFGPPVIWLTWRLLQRQGPRLPQSVAFAALLGLTWLTGSRTGVVAVAVAIVLMLIQHRRLPIGAVVTLIASVPVLFYIVFYTGAVSHYVDRSGTGNVTTLNSRTIAWSAAFSAPHGFWSVWFGGGMSVKTVAVSGTYWNAQVLDSSWVSAFVQGGAVGITTMGLFAISALFAAFRSRWPYRGLLPALVIYALIRSGLENGLLDSYVLFVAMLVPTLAAEIHLPGQPSAARRRPAMSASNAQSSAPSRSSRTTAT